MLLLERNSVQIRRTVEAYQSKRTLSVYAGLRNVLPVDAYPSFEIESTNAANEWATTRAQRPRYNFTCTLTTKTDNEKLHLEYITMLATTLTEIMCSPDNLQLQIANETKWDSKGGLSSVYYLDSLVEDVTYNAFHEGTIRTAEFSWFVTVHEPFPELKWQLGLSDTPCILRPRLVA